MAYYYYLFTLGTIHINLSVVIRGITNTANLSVFKLASKHKNPIRWLVNLVDIPKIVNFTPESLNLLLKYFLITITEDDGLRSCFVIFL